MLYCYVCRKYIVGTESPTVLHDEVLISEKVFVWSSDLDEMFDGDEGIQLL